MDDRYIDPEPEPEEGLPEMGEPETCGIGPDDVETK